MAAWTSSEERLHLAELGVLLGAGALAALVVSYVTLGLRIPGHAIVRAVLPMSLGLSLAPRRGGGLVMGASASSTVFLLGSMGGPYPGIGAMTSLCLLGPMMDLALWRIKSGWPVYLGFALAGGLANFAALLVRGTGKMSGLDGATQRLWADWATMAPWSYTVCGILAGLLSAAVWFRLRPARLQSLPSESGP